MRLNAGAFRVVEEILAQPDALGVSCHRSASGTRIVDCGVKSAGSIEAGILVARAALAGLGTVRIESPGPTPRPYDAAWPGCSWPIVAVESDQPLAACLASQYAGWKVSTNGYFAMASGPIRAAIGREDLFDSIGMRERADVAIGLLETAKLPPDEVCLSLAADAKVDADKLIVLVARTASTAGTLQVIARSLETALHKLHDLRFDLRRVRRGSGWAPLAPVPFKDDLAAIGRTNDAILYGGHVVLEVTGDDASLLDIGPRMVSRASADFGVAFCTLFERAGHDFYALDPSLFAPALVDLVNVDTGRRHRFGAIAPEIVTASFASQAAAAAGSGT
ncbi:MAG: methenyltetrahydromethanopterin cyclohydrolase [Planctomycetes bacterium]|nr:methenyltetrahydromethanopterin cyclohydrolase [Planctomycetota bacterium]